MISVADRPVVDLVLALQFELQPDPKAPGRTWREVTDELLRLHSLQNDWDGLGAVSPSAEVVQTCLELMRVVRDHEISPPTLLRPAPNGSLVFEWKLGEARVELEVSDDSLDLMSFDATGKTGFKQVAIR